MGLTYKLDLFAGDLVDILTRVVSIGNSSFTFGQQIERSDLFCAAEELKVVMVGEKGSTPIPQEVRKKLI